MKTSLLVFTLVLAFAWANAQDLPPFEFEEDNVPWPGLGSIPDFVMDAEGNLYLAVNDENEYYRTTIRKYEDGQWSTVAEAPYSFPFYSQLFEVAPDGTIYITDSSGRTVSRWNGISWEGIGTFERNVRLTSMAVAPDGTLYTAAMDSIYDWKTTVFALKDGSWQTVGNAGFRDKRVDANHLVIAPDGTPHVVYTTHPYGYNTVVMKLNGDTWEMVGPGIVEGAGSPRLAFSNDGAPFLAFSDSLYGYKATVMKLEVNVWQPVDVRGFSAAGAVPGIAVDNNGIPFVTYSDSSLDRRIIVKKSDGANWETVGNAGFSDFNAVWPSIQISPSGTPYVAYADQFNRVDEPGYRVRVARLEGDTWESVGSGDLFQGIHTLGALVAGNDGSLYIAYNYDYWFDPSFEDWMKTKVVRWKDDTLTDVGDVDYFKGLERIRLAIAPDQTLFMAYVDSATGYKISVLKLEDGSWEALGSPFDHSNSFDLDVDSTGTPYLTLQTNIWKWENGNWVTVSVEGFSESLVFPMTAVDKEGTLYVAYGEENVNHPIIKKLVGSAWEDISSENMEGGAVFLSIDESNNLQVVLGNYNSSENTYSINSFMKLVDGSWETIETDITGFNRYNMVMDAQGTFFVSTIDEEKEANVITFNDSGQETLVSNDLLKGHYPNLEVDKMGNLYMVFELDNIVVYNYGQDCTNPTDGGTIAGSKEGCDAFDAEMITSSSSPTGHAGTLVYKWQSSTTGSDEGFTSIEHHDDTYNPGILTQTTWFRRLAKVACMEDWSGAAFSNVVKMTVVTLPELTCPENDTVFNDSGSMTARKSYSALPEGTPDTLAVYMVDGKAITFPYDFPIGTTTVEVKANSSCAVDVACSFTVTVRQVTAIDALEANILSLEVYPNPFTDEMAIEIANPSLKEVSVEIYSISGQKIRTLARAQKGANISLLWDGTDVQGKKVPGGMYLLKVNEGIRKVVKR